MTTAPTTMPTTKPTSSPVSTTEKTTLPDAKKEEYNLADDAFDPESILAAWFSGDWAGLSYKNFKILEACTNVIYELITESMSEYEMELAIHDWIIDWAEYDREAISNAPNAKPDPDGDNPYGLLINKNAICRGYTTAFQLFMDMLGIECITVDGTARRGVEVHAWNMVRLDGDWYCVDVTWNDPIGPGNISPLIAHRFFNVTSKFLRDTDHQWDASNVPEAVSDKYAWRP